MKLENVKVFPDSFLEKAAGRKLSESELYEANSNALKLKELLEQELLRQKRRVPEKEVAEIDRQLSELKRNAVFEKD